MPFLRCRDYSIAVTSWHCSTTVSDDGADVTRAAQFFKFAQRALQVFAHVRSILTQTLTAVHPVVASPGLTDVFDILQTGRVAK